jgi:hypothetical protein
VLLLEVAEHYFPDYVGFARWYYRRRQFPLYQIVWPNNDGCYPWSPGATKAFKEWQPVLGTKPARELDSESRLRNGRQRGP